MSTRYRFDSSPWSLTNHCYLRSMTDTEVENYRARVAAGELLCNPMTSGSYVCSRVQAGKYQYTRYTRSKTQTNPTVYGPWINRGVLTLDVPLTKRAYTPYGPGAWNDVSLPMGWGASKTGMSTTGTATASEINAVHTNLSEKLAQGMTQSLVTLAEAPKTVKMVKEALKILRHPFQAAKNALRLTRSAIRNDAGSRKAYLDKAQDLWMEARFGWRPAVYDIMSHMEAIEKPFSVRQTVRGSIPITEKSVVTDFTNHTSSYFGAGRPYAVSSIAHLGLVRYRLGQTGDMLADFGVLQHFGAMDFLGTAWELVTLSWAVDYFLNVSDMLQSLQAYALLDERVGWTTRVVQFVAQHSSNLASGDYQWEFEKGVMLPSTDLSGSEVVTAKVRVPVTSFLPTFASRIDLNWMQVLDLSAVLRTLALKDTPKPRPRKPIVAADRPYERRDGRTVLY